MAETEKNTASAKMDEFISALDKIVDDFYVEDILSFINRKDYDGALSTIERNWTSSKDPADVRSLVRFGQVAYMGKCIDEYGHVLRLGGELKKRIGAMEALAGRLTGSFRGLVGNVIFILLAAAGLLALWTDPGIYAWLADYGIAVIFACVLFFCLLIWLSRGFRTAACTLGALAIISMGIIVNVPEETLLTFAAPAARIFATLAAAVIIFVFWLSSLRDNFYAVTHTREREADRAALHEEQKEAKHHIDVLLSQTEACKNLFYGRDKNLLDKLYGMNSKIDRETFNRVLDDAITIARAYCKYANSEIDRVVNKVR